MYDIEELERQWKRYHRKRLLFRGAVAIGILLLLAFPLLYVLWNRSAPFSENKKFVASKKAENLHERNRSISTTPIRKKELPSVLSSEVPSMQRREREKKKPAMLITFSSTEKESFGTQRGKQGGKVEMEMVKSANRSIVQEIEKRFPLSRDYDDAMYLAKYYYGKKKFKKAENWAMQANTIDSTKPESWMLFGKSKAKRGRRRDALKVLQAYYDRTGNIEVKMLIDKIRKGKKF